MIDENVLARAVWHKSSFSGGGGSGGGNCVEAAALENGQIAVRNSSHPEKGAVLFTRAEMHAWFKGVKTGEVRRPRIAQSARRPEAVTAPRGRGLRRVRLCPVPHGDTLSC